MKRPDGKTVLWSAVALLLMAGLTVATTHYIGGRDEPSQASAADCALAQRLIDRAQDVPEDEEEAEAWLRETHAQRNAEMKDGYLSGAISQYTGWAAHTASRQEEPPTDEEFEEMADKARSHCDADGRELDIPRITG